MAEIQPDALLVLGDTNTSSFDVPVVDDSVNEFYVKDTDDSTRKIIVKPYGQPFMEISLLFLKKSK